MKQMIAHRKMKVLGTTLARKLWIFPLIGIGNCWIPWLNQKQNKKAEGLKAKAWAMGKLMMKLRGRWWTCWWQKANQKIIWPQLKLRPNCMRSQWNMTNNPDVLADGFAPMRELYCMFQIQVNKDNFWQQHWLQHPKNTLVLLRRSDKNFNERRRVHSWLCLWCHNKTLVIEWDKRTRKERKSPVMTKKK